MNYSRWDKDEEETLLQLLNEGLSDTQIASKLQRSQNSVTAKVVRMQCAGLGYWRTRGRVLTLWTQQDEDLACKMWRKGNSASIISKTLNGRHSRNAVIAKMYRIGVSTPVQPPKALKPKNPRPKKVVVKKLTDEERVVKFFAEGMKPGDIAVRQKVRKSVIVDMLLKAGVDPTTNDPNHYHVHPVWSMNEDDRRMAFYIKFQAGWAEVLKRLAKPHA